jgi:hypothetical protein
LLEAKDGGVDDFGSESGWHVSRSFLDSFLVIAMLVPYYTLPTH